MRGAVAKEIAATLRKVAAEKLEIASRQDDGGSSFTAFVRGEARGLAWAADLVEGQIEGDGS